MPAMGTKEPEAMSRELGTPVEQAQRWVRELGTPVEQVQRWIREQEEQHRLWEDWLGGGPTVRPRPVRWAVFTDSGSVKPVENPQLTADPESASCKSP